MLISGWVQVAEYEIKIPLGSMSATTYSTLVERIRAESAAWSQLEGFDAYRGIKTNNIHGWDLYRNSKIREMVSFWRHHLSEIEEMDGREFSGRFDDFRRAIESSDIVPPASDSDVGRVIISHITEGDVQSAVALLFGFEEKHYSRFGIFGNHHDQESMYRAYSLGYYSAVLDANRVLPSIELIGSYSETSGQAISERLGQLLETRSNEAERLLSQLTKDIEAGRERYKRLYMNEVPLDL